MTPEQIEQERRTFEAWYAEECNLKEEERQALFQRFDEPTGRWVNLHGTYRKDNIQRTFECWLARARQPAWIAVTDSLPDDDRVVLVCAEDGSIFTDIWLEDDLVWQTAAELGLTVRYWQELPEPPEAV